MTTAPVLDPSEPRGFLERRYALLINPFYPKDPNASFGKHVLTPTLALTSFAATTPAHWRVEYWDENLLDGRPPFQPLPAGGRHHRAPDLRAAGLRTGATGIARAARRSSSAGCTCCRVPTNVRPTPTRWRSAMACNSGRAFCATSKRTACSRATSPLTRTTTATIRPPRRSILPRRSFLTTTSLIATRGCHNRCGFCYLATDGLRMPYRMRHPATGGRRVPGRRPALRRLHRQQPRFAPRLPARSSAPRCARSRRSGARPSPST